MSGLVRKLLCSLVVLSVLGGLVGGGTFSNFQSDSAADGSTYAAGTVSVSDNDAGAALYTLSGLEPGMLTERCIKVTYSGTLDGEVRLHTDSSLGALASYLDLTITPGTQSGQPAFGSCTSFTPDAGGALFTGTLASFASAHSSWASGLADPGPAAATSWSAGQSVVYKVGVAVRDDDAAANKSTGAHRFIFEARNQ